METSKVSDKENSLLLFLSSTPPAESLYLPPSLVNHLIPIVIIVDNITNKWQFFPQACGHPHWRIIGFSSQPSDLFVF